MAVGAHNSYLLSPDKVLLCYITVREEQQRKSGSKNRSASTAEKQRSIIEIFFSPIFLSIVSGGGGSNFLATLLLFIIALANVMSLHTPYSKQYVPHVVESMSRHTADMLTNSFLMCVCIFPSSSSRKQQQKQQWSEKVFVARVSYCQKVVPAQLIKTTRTPIEKLCLNPVLP